MTDRYKRFNGESLACSAVIVLVLGGSCVSKMPMRQHGRCRRRARQERRKDKGEQQAWEEKEASGWTGQQASQAYRR